MTSKTKDIQIQKGTRMKIKIPGYTISETVHQSSETLIYRGTQSNNQQTIILKTINSQHPTEKDINRLKYECQILPILSQLGEGILFKSKNDQIQ